MGAKFGKDEENLAFWLAIVDILAIPFFITAGWGAWKYRTAMRMQRLCNAAMASKDCAGPPCHTAAYALYRIFLVSLLRRRPVSFRHKGHSSFRADAHTRSEDAGRTCPESGPHLPKSPELRQLRTNVVRPWADIRVESRSHGGNVVRLRPNLGQCWPTSSKFRRSRTNLA